MKQPHMKKSPTYTHETFMILKCLLLFTESNIRVPFEATMEKDPPLIQ